MALIAIRTNIMDMNITVYIAAMARDNMVTTNTTSAPMTMTTIYTARTCRS